VINITTDYPQFWNN